MQILLSFHHTADDTQCEWREEVLKYIRCAIRGRLPSLWYELAAGSQGHSPLPRGTSSALTLSYIAVELRPHVDICSVTTSSELCMPLENPRTGSNVTVALGPRCVPTSHRPPSHFSLASSNGSLYYSSQVTRITYVTTWASRK